MPDIPNKPETGLTIRPRTSKNPVEIYAALGEFITACQDFYGLFHKNSYLNEAILADLIDKILIPAGQLRQSVATLLSSPISPEAVTERKKSAKNIADFTAKVTEAIEALTTMNDEQMTYLRALADYQEHLRPAGAVYSFSIPEGENGEKYRALLACNAKIAELRTLWQSGNFSLSASLAQIVSRSADTSP